MTRAFLALAGVGLFGILLARRIRLCRRACMALNVLFAELIADYRKRYQYCDRYACNLNHAEDVREWN